MFESELDAKTFHAYLNTKHKNIKLTYEKQIDNKLPFLDILRSNNENLQTSVFHQKTYKGLLLNYFSFVPDSYKYGLIKTLFLKLIVGIGLIVLGQVLILILKTSSKSYLRINILLA